MIEALVRSRRSSSRKTARAKSSPDREDFDFTERACNLLDYTISLNQHPVQGWLIGAPAPLSKPRYRRGIKIVSIMPSLPDNSEIAAILEQIASLLEIQGANPFRVQAYRKAASTLREANVSASELVMDGEYQALEDIPNIGSGLAGLIQEIVKTGESSQLRRLQSEIDPTSLLSRVPGIGQELAGRVIEELGVESLEELELAAHDGRLDRVEGFGERRIEAVKTSVAGMLSPAARRESRRATETARKLPQEPGVATILDVDREYREKAKAGKLRKIAPKRFNPHNEAWLPILNTKREDWSFTALYSNTKRAHELGKTDDWVVVYYERDGEERQCTVVTETGGDLEGKRVVRGRESESREFYEGKG